MAIADMEPLGGEVGDPQLLDAEPLNATRVAAAVEELARRDGDLARLLELYGPPPLWPREPGFETLVRLILEQQVSLDSGRAAFRRLEDAVGRVEPRSVVAAGRDRLAAAGLTRQKSRYLVGLAESVLDGRLPIDDMSSLGDESVRAALLPITGIGPWTADCYLLFALRRPDAWPAADIALAAAAQEAKGLAARPSPVELERLAESWRPWRGVAARMLWHAYLRRRGRSG